MHSPPLPTYADLVRLGQQAIYMGELTKFRSRIGITRNAIAKLIPVSADALIRWETGAQALSVASAVKVGEWYWGAQKAIEDLERSGMNIEEWTPISSAAKFLSLSQEQIEEKCRRGELRCESLGVLGQWVLTTDIPALNK